MQILGKRSKVLLIAVAIAILVALGVSFATWDKSAANAASGDLSQYANAKVGDVITFGKYYQTGKKDAVDPSEYEKTPIEWIVVDKDERTGQLTLMSKYILASGSYFGNNYYSATNSWGNHYDNNTSVAGNPYNQAYIDSTARAYLNNLERLDMGGDAFESGKGYVPSAKNSTTDGGLLSSVGFSNQRYWTGLSYTTEADKTLVDKKIGLGKRADGNDIYYQRPINNAEYKERPAARGFLDEAFNEAEKSMIVPKQIAGYIGHRWPDNANDVSTKSFIEGAYDKVWLPSVTELNIVNGKDWNSETNDAWTNPSDEAGSTVFEYFKNYDRYGFSSLTQAIQGRRTPFLSNGYAMNYSVPVYNKGTTTVNKNISTTKNAGDIYWTRSPSSFWYYNVRYVSAYGLCNQWDTNYAFVGVRPCVIVKF